MTHLARKVEDDVGTRGRVTDVGTVDLEEIALDHDDRRLRFGPVIGHEVPGIRAVAGHARVEDRDLGTMAHEGQGEVRSDEAEAAGDQAPTTGKCVARYRVQSVGQLTGTRPSRLGTSG